MNVKKTKISEKIVLKITMSMTVANLIVDQQAMAKAFQERGDRHSGSLERHRAQQLQLRKYISSS